MKTLLLVENNLEQDTRMKRHVRALLDMGQRVTVVGTPQPSANPGLRADNLDVQLWTCPEITLRAETLQGLAESMGLTRYLYRACPALLAPNGYRALGLLSRRLQAQQLKANRWREFRDAIGKDGVEPAADFRGLAGFFEFMLRWAERACEIPADLVYCVDLTTLLAGVAHKAKYGSRLVFDAHEIFYDMAPGNLTLLWKQTLALLEYHLVGKADWVMGVSASHADWMRRTYALPAERVLCVPNCFGVGQDVSPPPPRLLPPGQPLRIYYHGSSDPYRGLDAITRAVASVPDTQLILRCPPSPTLDLVRRISIETGAEERVKILPMVPPERMIDAIRAEADFGIHVTCDQPVALNLKVALTNKFIEYLLAGIPVITAPLEEQARIVRDHDVGFVLENNSVEAIRQGLLWVLQHRHRQADMEQRAHQAGVAHFGWRSIRATLEQAVGQAPRMQEGKAA